jgi:hypothetical protein
MKKILLASCLSGMVLFNTVLYSCTKNNFPPHFSGSPDVAVAWMNMYLRLTKGTPGFNSIVSSRAYAYAGLTLYESVVPGIPICQSIMRQLNSSAVMPVLQHGKKYYWPASANAAMAVISKKLFANTSPALLAAIDSLETDLNNKMKDSSSAEELQRSTEYGRLIATNVFEWSKTDGGHEAYNTITSDNYIPPTGDGLWVPTPPAFGKPVHPYWGSNRSFLPNMAASTQPAPPPAYSNKPGSIFDQAVREVYDVSKRLTIADTITARFWADLPANYNVPAHATNIVTQLILLRKLSLQEAAVLYCKHGIAMNEALISCFKAKYQYNMVRPITYIRNVLGHNTWNALIATPAHPEYTSAHAVISGAVAEVLQDAFGQNFSFTDNTYSNLYGTRHFSSFKEYAQEASISRLLGGIHYRFTAEEGLTQGKKVGQLINKLKFKK